MGQIRSSSSTNSSPSTASSRCGGGFSLEVLEERPGFLSFRASGQCAVETFANEGGGHRWQHEPNNEKRGRIHTSTVTVAVLPEPSEQELRLDPRDLEITAARGQGPGGQARNKTESAVIVKHKPSGVMVRCDVSRSQQQNRSTALGMLRAKLLDTQRSAAKAAENAQRKSAVGSGCRGDKIVTVREQDDVVTDHRTGKKIRFKDYQRGEWDGLL